VLASLLSLVLAVAAPPAPAPASASTAVVDPLGVQVRVLGNGLTVMLSVNRERPEVFGAVVVRTGARNDPAGETGMAHYLEHMLFKGTRRLARC
jgi:predicted Zn-dependent peptidase